MNREQFFTKLEPLDDERVRKVLWNLYWRGSAALRQRIEAEIEPAQTRGVQATAQRQSDPEVLLIQIRTFVELARKGAYLGGDRRVSPKERTRWRFTFKQLVIDARTSLAADDPRAGIDAMEALLGLACDMRGSDYFRSEDPIEAAKVVVSDEVAALWGRLLECSGFQAFAERAARQLIEWESEFGWTRTGYGHISEKETSLTVVLGQLLRFPDAWSNFFDRYLEALDRLAPVPSQQPARRYSYAVDHIGHTLERRASELRKWHLTLLQRFGEDEIDSQRDPRLDRLVTHPSLAGPEVIYLRARLAQHRSDTERARQLIREALGELPGHAGFLAFAAEIGEPAPHRAH